MSRVSIDVTPQEHQKLKAMAALQGKTIKEFVLASTLGAASPDEAVALAELETLLKERLRQVESGRVSKRTVEDIFQQAIDEAGNGPDA